MTPPQIAPDPMTMACLEVWGGNEPVDTALRVPGLDVWVYAVPFGNSLAGGDVHFVSSCGTGRIARLMVADVSGHGAEVAGIARGLRNLIHRFMNHVDPRRFVRAMNRDFTQLSKIGRFATAVVMTYFSPTGEMSLCNAGHPPPLVYQRAKGQWRYVEGVEDAREGNLPLGISGDGTYGQFKLDLATGDLVLCYTDSLVEAVCRDGSLLGYARLLDLMRTISVDEPAHWIHHLLAKMAVVGATPNDDVTLLLTHCNGRSPGAGLGARLRALVKFVGQVLTVRRNIPWPEVSVKLIRGVVPPFWKRQRN